MARSPATAAGSSASAGCCATRARCSAELERVRGLEPRRGDVVHARRVERVAEHAAVALRVLGPRAARGAHVAREAQLETALEPGARGGVATDPAGERLGVLGLRPDALRVDEHAPVDAD